MKLSLIVTLAALTQPLLAAQAEEATAVARAIGSFSGVLDTAVAKGSETQSALMMKGSYKKSPGGNSNKQNRKKRRSGKKNKSTSNSSSKSKNKKRKSSSSSRSKKGKSRSYRLGYGMCGRNMRSRDRRACDRLEREFCGSKRQIRQNRSLCYQLGFTRYYSELGTDLHEYENEDENEDNACNCNEWEREGENEGREWENEGENEGNDWDGDNEGEDEDEDEGPDYM